MLPTYQSILGDGGEQRRLTQAQILFDIADRAGAFAAGVDPRTGQRVQGSPAAQLAAAASGLGGQIGERLGSQEEQDRALRLAALQAAQGEYSAERAAARAAGSRDRALGTLYDVYDREGNLVQQGVPIATRKEYDAVIGALGEGARITPARTDTVSFDTTTLYGPDGSPVTIDTSTAAGVTRARDLIDNGGFTTVAPTAAGFDTTTLYGPDGTPVTINTGTPEGQARADDLMDNEGFTTVAPTAAGFDTTTLYGPDGRPVTINTGTPEGQARADDLLTNQSFTTVAPTAAGFDTTTLYGPDGRPVTINTGTPEGQARADDLLTNQSFTTVAPTGEIGKQYEAVDAQGNVLASAFLADRAAFDKFVADNPGTTIREALTQELGDEVLLYNPNDLNAPPVRERVGTPTYNMSRNAGLRTLEEIDDLRKLTTTEAPATLIERQQAAITNQNTLDNLESLSPQELGLFAANAAAYIQETVSPAGVSSRLPLPPNTQEAMRRAYALGIDFGPASTQPSSERRYVRKRCKAWGWRFLISTMSIWVRLRALSPRLHAASTSLANRLQKLLAERAPYLHRRRRRPVRLMRWRKLRGGSIWRVARSRENLKTLSGKFRPLAASLPTQMPVAHWDGSVPFLRGSLNALWMLLKIRVSTRTPTSPKRAKCKCMRHNCLRPMTSSYKPIKARTGAARQQPMKKSWETLIIC
jgi:hypothetical protein